MPAASLKPSATARIRPAWLACLAALPLGSAPPAGARTPITAAQPPSAEAQAADTACPGAKFRGHGVCEALQALGPEEYLRFDIILASITADSGKDYAFARMRERAQDLFTRFDLRHRHDTALRLPVPADPSAVAGYEQIQMRKRTVLELVREAYVQHLDLVPAYGTFCPGPKIGNPALCSVLQARGESGYLLVQVSLRPSMPGAENLPEELARLAAETDSLYARFDLRDALDTARRATAPAGPDVGWYHGPFQVTGRTVAALVEAPYVHWMSLGTIPVPAATERRPARSSGRPGPLRSGGGGVDALGRLPAPSSRLMDPPSPLLPRP